MTSITEATQAGTVRVEVDGPVATLILDRPAKRNALTPEMLSQLDEHLALLGTSTEARVVLVRGAGEGVFCAGADIGRFAGLAPTEMWRSWTTLGHAVFDRLASLRQPVIAVLHGNAFGGGLELALAADFRIMAESAIVGLPETGLGTVPGWGGTERLVELIGPARAKEVVMGRRHVDAATALSWGAVTAVAPAERIEAAVEELVGQLVGGAPIAVQLAKQLINAAAEGAPSRILEPLAGALTAATADLAEGIQAFGARRAPAFTGS